MKNSHVLILTLVAAIIAAGAPLIAQDGRPLRTLPHGDYQCALPTGASGALPGDGIGDAYEVIEAEGFTISNASRYRSPKGGGTYLMRGIELVFTSGPKKDQRFERTGDSTVRLIGAKGERTRLTCTRLPGTG